MTHTFESAVRRIFSAYTVDLTPAMTEDGVQHIRLTGSDGSTFLLGWVSFGSKRAELRTLGHTLALSKARFGRELRLPPVEYMRFLDNATNVLEELDVKVEVVAYAKPVRLTLPYAARLAASARA